MNTDNLFSMPTSPADSRPDLLLQYLYQIQYQYSFIPQQSVKYLSEKLSLTESHIHGVIGFYSFLHESARGTYDILFSDSITDHMTGSRELMADLCKKLGVTPGEPRADGRVTVDTTSCTGMCDQGPAMLVNGWTVTRLDQGRIDAISQLIESNTAIEQWPDEFFQVEDNIQRRDFLLSDDSASADALRALIDQGDAAVLEQIESSGLRGRGGAGFKTGMKWRFCKQAEADQHFVVCNADEGEPGTFKDRVLLNSYADKVFDGMALCAGIIGAKKGYLYLRGEYRYLREPLEQILQQRRDEGLLGKDILGKQGFDFDIEIHMGAGAYICGEESSLIESLEGKRGIPRKRPPFPVTNGYMDQPTVVNNVETFISAALIAVHGAEWFRSVGTAESSGTKLLSISGDCEKPGIYEYPFGVSIQDILKDCGAIDAQAVQVAGAAGMTVPAEEFERRIAFEDVSTGGSLMVFNRERDMLDMVKNFADFFVHESCGFCTPCRVGGSLLKDLVNKVHSGHAGEYDLKEMSNIGQLMRTASHCGLGATAANPVLDTLSKFPNIYQKRLKHTGYEPAFDLDAALQDARDITGRDDPGAHIGTES
ncbi:MAG: NAD(P)H-dependent oxidoreductase subunit E [Thiotrichales bacterium]|nr:MAG: NAD(P)H-dependent oxidoreductase subunit E [Thiotrichales bacterium]